MSDGVFIIRSIGEIGDHYGLVLEGDIAAVRDAGKFYGEPVRLVAAAPAPTVSGPSGKTDGELLQHIVLPMVRERSREAGDAWDQASNALEAAISAYVSAPTVSPTLEQARDDLPPVERIACVSWERGYEEPADPVWRVRVGECCTDFEAEQAANNFRQAIIDHFAPTRAQLAKAREALEPFADDGHKK